MAVKLILDKVIPNRRERSITLTVPKMGTAIDPPDLDDVPGVRVEYIEPED
jgi:hypothetical protein